MRRALILGASGGIGAALVAALEARGSAVTGLSRSATGLDLTDAASVARAAAQLSPPFDLIVNAAGALEIAGRGPEKRLADIEAEAFTAQFALNATGMALALRHFAPLLGAPRPVFAGLTARLGSIGDNALGGWMAYRASKAAANQILRTASVELARTRPGSVVVALHPGTVATPMTDRYAANRPRLAPAEAAAGLLAVIDRLTPADTGSFYDMRGLPIAW
ncbi:SDR family NAD(P)-dependent oxidoreductase [Paracoccus contaminans]|uniref:C factor, cell signaling protein n=1 Tax=Paracoccus contaminans TaxID=1945662 RepID=A0A1W6CW60_9RHOB|nr:SDR family NAD(P)-dependent oxidoreductase [Paracoccus contaminans]ARJ69097.1 C factor, cell signaling protein [Paracoccus contaminans]